MSLSFQSLSALPVQPILDGAFRLAAQTSEGYRNLTLQAIQTYVNAPVLELIEQIGTETGPSIWPAKRTITLSGAASGSVQMDGSTDVTLNTTIDTAGLTFSTNSIPLLAVTGLETRLSGIEGTLAGFNKGPNGFIAPFKIARNTNDDLIHFQNGATTYARFRAGSGWLTFSTHSDNDGGGVLNGLRYNNDGRLVHAAPDGSVINTFWHSGTFNPALKQNILNGTAAQVTMGNASYRPVSDFALINGTPVFTETVAQNSATSFWGVLGRKDSDTIYGGLWFTGVGEGYGNVSLANSIGGWKELAIQSNGGLAYTVGGVTNAVFHSGNFTPSNYSLTTHKHGAGDITSGTFASERVVAGTVVDNTGAALVPGGMPGAWRINQRSLADQQMAGTGVATVLTITPGGASSTLTDHQLSFSGLNGSLFRRMGDRTNGWGSHYRIFDEAWFNPASPVPDGQPLRIGATDAAGARINNQGALSINGSAFSRIITTADFNSDLFVPKLQNPPAYSDPNWYESGHLVSGVVGSDIAGSAEAFTTVWNFGQTFQRAFQMASSYGAVNKFWMRSQQDSATTNNGWVKPWVELHHTGNFNPSSKMDNRPELQYNGASISDWNAAVNAGWYMAAGASNAPTPGGEWYMGSVFAHNSDWIQQEAWRFTDGPSTVRYRRHKNAGTWTDWTMDETVGTLFATAIAAGYNPGIAGSISCTNWFRSNGVSGIYFADYGGGLHMSDSLFVRTYNGKAMAASWFETYGTHAPNSSANACSYRATGNYGGGYGLVDGTNHSTIFSDGGNLTFGFGVNMVQYHRYSMRSDGLMLAGDYGLTSDERLKDYMSPLRYRGRLEPLEYMWKESGKWDLGFGAQRTMAQYPESVHYDGANDTYRLRPMKLIAVLSAQANINEDRIEKLEQENRDLRAQLDRVLAHLGLE